MAARTHFWARQFGRNVSRPQRIFDLIAGVLLPIACLVADPIVFKGGGFGGPLLRPLALFAYLFIGIEIGALLLWLRSRLAPAFSAGVLLTGGLVSLLLGIVLIPFSLLGLLVAIGALGFSPLVASFAYWRHGLRALAAARERGPARRWLASAGLGVLLAVSIPALAQWSVSREVTRGVAAIVAGEAEGARSASRRLRWLSPVADIDRLVAAYVRETDPLRRERLADAYVRITGTGIEQRMAILND